MFVQEEVGEVVLCCLFKVVAEVVQDWLNKFGVAFEYDVGSAGSGVKEALAGFLQEFVDFYSDVGFGHWE